MMPTAVHDCRWPIRSMLWIRKDLEARQISVDSADTAANCTIRWFTPQVDR